MISPYTKEKMKMNAGKEYTWNDVAPKGYDALASVSNKASTCFDRLDQSVGYLRELVTRAERLASELTGPAMEDGFGGGQQAPISGRFDQIEVCATSVRMLCEQLSDAMGRIEKRM